MISSSNLALAVLLACLAVCNCQFQSSASGPRIVIDPNEPIFFIDTQYPSSKVLTCSAAGDQPGMFSQLKWSGPNRENNSDELSRRHLVSEETPNSNVWSLEFKNPTVDDAGRYCCRGTYHSSEVFTACIQVKVTTPIKLENCPEVQYVKAGATGQSISCRVVADSPKITLFKDGEPLENLRNRYRWNDEKIDIEGPAEQIDAGKYTIRVRATRTGERKDQVVHVELHTPPTILAYNGTYPEFQAVEGQPAELKCDVTGVPRPLVTWLDPRLRNLSDVGGYYANRETGVLRIEKAKKFDDNGDFICKAHNDVAEVQRKVSMAVNIRPDIVAFDNTTAREGEEVILSCRSTGDPKPHFSIRRQGMNQVAYMSGDPYVIDMDIKEEGGDSNIWVYRLRIRADRSLSGFHYCNATNRAGSNEKISQLLVAHKPDLTQTPPEQFVRLGKPMAITCHIKAYPRPTVSWWTDHTQILNVDANTKESPDRQTYIVTMRPPNPQQTAFNRYTCRAENSEGISEQAIMIRHTTIPGSVLPHILETTPTTVKLSIEVPNDGGDRIRYFKYRLEGRTLDMHNPLYAYRIDRQNDSRLDASLSLSTTYTIKNLLPFYAYRLSIQAVNDVGEGDSTDSAFQTNKPTRPDPPTIIRPVFNQMSNTGIASDYSNGYLLKWSPPDLDNGDKVIKYIIKMNRVDSNALDIVADGVEERLIEQMNERPMFARIGPLLSNQRYKIQLQARNSIGDSNPDHIIIYTTPDRPPMVEFDAQTLAWLMDTPTSMVLALLGTAIFLLIFIDLAFCYCCQIGVTHLMGRWCCPSKTNSVISDKTYN